MAVLAVTPAGAAVVDWIGDVVTREESRAEPEPIELPADGRLLVGTRAGAWIVRADGSKRLLAGYAGATWSPQGLFVAAWRDRRLAALETGGRVRWEITAPGRIATARWSPSGLRIAYLSAGALRVVAGDGTGDRLLQRRAARAAPAWSPGSRHVLAYVDGGGRLTVRDADTRKVLWRADPGVAPLQLAWSGDGARLAVAGAGGLRVYSRDGRLVERSATPLRTGRVPALAYRPGGRELALIRPGPQGGAQVILRAGRERALFSGPGSLGGIAWSPDGRWLLIARRGSDRWLFVVPGADRRARSFDRIAERFDPGGPLGPQAPVLAGWTG